MIATRVIGAAEAARGMHVLAAGAPAAIGKVVTIHGRKYRDTVRKRASGRPGPNIITKKYWNSIRMADRRSGSLSTVMVGTDSPQGHRLENGFYGEDSRGRSYHQGPFPHWEPDLQAIADSLQVAVANIVILPDAAVVIDSAALNTVSFS